MEKFYKLKEEVYKYISSEKDKYLQLPMQEWVKKGYSKNAVEDVNENHFVYGAKIKNITHLCMWQNNTSNFYFTLLINGSYKENDYLNDNNFKDIIIEKMNKVLNETYNEFMQHYEDK